MNSCRKGILPGIFLLITFMVVIPATAQKTLHIIAFHHSSNQMFFNQAVTEIEGLLGHRYALDIVPIDTSGDMAAVKTVVEQQMASTDVDIVVALSPAASSALAQLKSYAKPAIAAAVLDRRLQGIIKTDRHTSGVHHFTYIESPFDIQKDLKTFKAIFEFKHLGVLINRDDMLMFPDLYGYLGKQLSIVHPEATFSLIEIDPKDPLFFAESIEPPVDAVYLTPALAGMDESLRKAFIQQLNNKKIPTFSLLGESDVQAGAMAAIAPNANMIAISRRIALDIMKIAEGTDPADLNVVIDTYGDNFVLNMATMKNVGIYPDWEIINRARIIIPDQAPGTDAVGLLDVIALGLEKNLDLISSRYNTRIQKKEVDSARSNRLPQAVFTSTARVLDKERAGGNPGEPAPGAWTATGQLSQTVFSDDVNAGIGIQTLLAESSLYQEKTDTLDTVTDVVEGYINLLLAQSNYHIFNNNLNVTRKNLDIAKIKQSVGYVGASDVYRWESELARDKISFNDTHRDVRIAEMALNRLIDRPLNQPIQVMGMEIGDPDHFFMADPRVKATIRNFKQMELLSHFLVEEADRQLPELKQISATIKAQNRQLLNLQRDFYLPDFQLNAQVDKTLEEWNTNFKTPGDLDHPWSVGLTASLPLWSGGRRKHELAREKLQLDQYHIDERNLKNRLYLRVRSNIETLSVSHREVQLSQDAQAAARKNFNIVQDAYTQGSLGVTDLVDAQNAMVQAEQGAVIAKYQMLLDIFNLERSVGGFHFLRTQGEKEAFSRRFQTAFAK